MYMQTFYLHGDEKICHTGIGAQFETRAATRENFESAKELAVDAKIATFLLDLCDEDDDILDTIFLDSDGYEQITGEPARCADYYLKYDADYWKAAKSEAGLA